MDVALLRDASILVVDDAPANVALLTPCSGLPPCSGSTASPIPASPGVLAAGAPGGPGAAELQMPHLDGFEVMGSLQAATPDEQFVPILVLT